MNMLNAPNMKQIEQFTSLQHQVAKLGLSMSVVILNNVGRCETL